MSGSARKKVLLKVIILGDSGVGKTSFEPPRDPENFPFVLLELVPDQEQYAIYEVSAKEAVNVEEAFQAIARNALQRDSQETHDFPEFPDQIRLNNSHHNNRDESSSCNC
uniref:Uncharacterized protein n=1 Tax=Ditylenchus dipsaci TaxID=166011 RepID=A0A915EM26_9BILA